MIFGYTMEPSLSCSAYADRSTSVNWPFEIKCTIEYNVSCLGPLARSPTKRQHSIREIENHRQLCEVRDDKPHLSKSVALNNHIIPLKCQETDFDIKHMALSGQQKLAYSRISHLISVNNAYRKRSGIDDQKSQPFCYGLTNEVATAATISVGSSRRWSMLLLFQYITQVYAFNK